MNQGDLFGLRMVFTQRTDTLGTNPATSRNIKWACRPCAEEPHRTGVRAAIVALKRGNARGAKGRRKVDA